MLESGANCIIMGASEWKIFQHLGLKLKTASTVSCIIGDNSRLECIGELDLPIKLKHCTKFVSVKVVPSITHALVLGTNLWIRMGVIPHLRKDEWFFSEII